MRPVFLLLFPIIFMQFHAAARQPKTDVQKPVFTYVQQMPEFPGGIDQMKIYLARHMHYPDSARLANIQGRVFVKFVIDEYGDVGKVQVLRGIGGGCDEEAARVISSMPRWKPGLNDGKPVRVYFTLPITFRLERDKKPADTSARD